MRSSARRLVTLIGASVVVAGCLDSGRVTSPASVGGSGAARQLLSSPAAVTVLTRTAPLESSETASAVIGVLGGRITLPAAGLTVDIPALALASPTLISVTAVAGSQVAYEFAPHGQQFAVPLVVTQTLIGTTWTPGSTPGLLHAGYFQSVLDLDPSSGRALVSELFGASLGPAGATASFAVSHFSGYLIATGDGSGEGDGSQQ